MLNNKYLTYTCYFMLLLLSVVLNYRFLQNPWIQILGPFDTSVYAYIGKIMNEGYLPYRDIFDHKGPITYLWYALGYKIHPISGIWYLEVVWLYLAFIVAFKIALHHIKPILAILSLIALFLLAPRVDTFGNTESFALLPIFYAIFILEKYIAGENINRLNCLLLGFFSALLLMVKPPYLVIPAVVVLYIFTHFLYLRKYRLLGQYALYLAIGFTVPLILVLGYFYRNDALDDLWHDYIEFNLLYSKVRHFNTYQETFLYFISYSRLYIFLLFVLIVFLEHKKLKKTQKIEILLFGGIWISLFAGIIYLRNPYYHYVLILWPLFYMFVIYALQCIKYEKIVSLLFICVITFYLISDYQFMKGHIKETRIRNMSLKSAVNFLNTYLKEGESFASFAKDFNASYFYANKKPASKFSFIVIVYNLIPQQIIDDFRKKEPRVILEPVKFKYFQPVNPDEYEIIYANGDYAISVKKEKQNKS